MTIKDRQQEFASLRQPMYLGDSVYASWNGYHVKLFTDDGHKQVIYLDDQVRSALAAYFKHIHEFHLAVAADLSGGEG